MGCRVIQFTAVFIRTASKRALKASQQARLQWLRTMSFLYPVYPSRNQWNGARKSTPELELNVQRSCCIFYTIGKPRKSPQKIKFNDWGRLFLPAMLFLKGKSSRERPWPCTSLWALLTYSITLGSGTVRTTCKKTGTGSRIAHTSHF